MDDRARPPASVAAAVPPDASDEERELLRAMPKEVGVLLLVMGVGGLLFPGPIGTPFVIAGGVVLWPSVFERVESWFARRFPKMHRLGVGQIKRFVDDLDRRYPPRA